MQISREKIAALSSAGTTVMRAGLVLALGLIGLLKFTPEEAMGIQPLVSHSPLFSWLYAVAPVQLVSNIFGTLEIATSILILMRAFNPSLSAIGSAMAVGTFLSTLSFLITTPGIWSPHYGFPALSGVGSFLIKDVTLLGAAIYTCAEALAAAFSRQPTPELVEP